MKSYGAFDILGPIMIGPSSSHTAGAARLGKVAREIVNKKFDKVEFYLHGSFAHTYRGHGTDKALVAGILGMGPDDENLRTSMDIAAKKNIEIEFKTVELEGQHPNTAKIVFYEKGDVIGNIIGSSIGGGSIKITSVDGYSVDLTGDYPAVIVEQHDRRGVISSITTVLAEYGCNIATMNVTRNSKGKDAFTIIQMDHGISEDVVDKIMELENVISVRALNPGH
ncbi:L-serine dehydratase [Hathewaya proteolytica DSM 3090]|uniref:L-serine deaminase n=1 Tax=Hathewaya proteolytica DSM 3090 TaxID=1121331 RepID=A0A1M6QAW7_9CLOT|nr:L-serine ammonia-lyase, iron-sulfur-dependent subunit beta [Hathewaya proteolytica]SHK17392.1 L-serine dehydratase [Hathewaya proteolytica DSM 3090]